MLKLLLKKTNAAFHSDTCDGSSDKVDHDYLLAEESHTLNEERVQEKVGSVTCLLYLIETWHMETISSCVVKKMFDKYLSGSSPGAWLLINFFGTL